MVTVLPDADTGLMVLQVKRMLHGKTWWFELDIAQEFWEDLPSSITKGQDPKTVPEAYGNAREFWDWLGEENADALEASAVPGSPDRHIRYVWPDHQSLETAYRRHRR